ncbi:MAG: WD40 repeat domain-containing protein [Microthrixaceae bacterium]
MTRKTRLIWLITANFFIFTFIACQSSEAETPVFQEFTVTITASLPVTTKVGTAIITPTVTQVVLPTFTNDRVTLTPSPSPTAAPIQMIEKLPINGVIMAISVDRTFIAVVNRNSNTVYGYDLTTEKVIWQFSLNNHIPNVASFDLSPNGDLLALGGAISPSGVAGEGMHENVYVLSTGNGELVQSFLVPYHVVDSVSFSPDSRYLAVSAYESFSSDYGVMVWEMESWQLAYELLSSSYHWDVFDTVFVPGQESTLAVVTTNLNIPEEFDEDEKGGGLYFWDLSNQQIYEAISGTFALSVATSPSGRYVAAYIDGNLRVWDIQSELEVLNIVVGETADTRRLALTDTGIIGNLDTKGVLTIWNLRGELLTTLETEGTISDIAFSSSEKLIITSYIGNEAQPVEIWQINK